MYKRKTKDIWEVLVRYYGSSFDVVYSSESYSEARKVKQQYLENDTFALEIRLKKHREKIKENGV